MSIKDNLELVKIILEIFNLLKPLIKLAWTKIKELFSKRKKTLYNKLIEDTTHNLEYYGYKNTINWI